MSVRKLKAAVRSHVGNVRENNEDNYYLNGSYRTDVTQEVSQAAGLYELAHGIDDFAQTDQPGYKKSDRREKPESKAGPGEGVRRLVESLIRRVESFSCHLKREEDSVMKVADRFFLAAVADGMGGEDAGEIASLFAVESLRDWEGGDAREAASACVRSANVRICARMRECKKRRMGSTIAVLALDGERALCCNVGDSRIYRLRDGNLTQLSTDHNRAASMVAAGFLTAEKAQTDKTRHELTQHLGIPPEEMELEPAFREEAVLAGDLFLLCSDGLSEMVPDPEILALLSLGGTPDEQAKRLLDQALANGGRDNVTVMVVQVEKGGGDWRELKTGIRKAAEQAVALCSEWVSAWRKSGFQKRELDGGEENERKRKFINMRNGKEIHKYEQQKGPGPAVGFLVLVVAILAVTWFVRNNSGSNLGNTNSFVNTTRTDTSTGTAGLEYTAKDGSYHVTGYSGTSVNIVIPDTYNGVPVTEIEDGSFSDHRDLQSVVIGSNVTDIGPNAFNYQTLLKEVTLGENMTEVNGFDGCISLTTIEIPASVTRIGISCFLGCTSLTTVTFAEGSNLNEIGNSAFKGCTMLKELTLPSSLQKMGQNVFSGWGEDQTIIFSCGADDIEFNRMIAYKTGEEPPDKWDFILADCDAKVVYMAD